MEKINVPILCGNIEVDISNHKKITKINAKTDCVCLVPSIIKNIINEYDIKDVEDIIESLYCQKCGNTLHYDSCGRALLRELSLLTFK